MFGVVIELCDTLVERRERQMQHIEMHTHEREMLVAVKINMCAPDTFNLMKSEIILFWSADTALHFVSLYFLHYLNIRFLFLHTEAAAAAAYAFFMLYVSFIKSHRNRNLR